MFEISRFQNIVCYILSEQYDPIFIFLRIFVLLTRVTVNKSLSNIFLINR